MNNARPFHHFNSICLFSKFLDDFGHEAWEPSLLNNPPRPSRLRAWVWRTCSFGKWWICSHFIIILGLGQVERRSLDKVWGSKGIHVPGMPNAAKFQGVDCAEKFLLGVHGLINSRPFVLPFVRVYANAIVSGAGLLAHAVLLTMLFSPYTQGCREFLGPDAIWCLDRDSLLLVISPSSADPADLYSWLSTHVLVIVGGC